MKENFVEKVIWTGKILWEGVPLACDVRKVFVKVIFRRRFTNPHQFIYFIILPEIC
jgi:hypothetical protein